MISQPIERAPPCNYFLFIQIQVLLQYFYFHCFYFGTCNLFHLNVAYLIRVILYVVWNLKK